MAFIEGTLQDVDKQLGPSTTISNAEQFSQNAPPETERDLGATAVRYGIPLGVAALNPAIGVLSLAATSAGSELAAQQMEQGLHTPSVGDLSEAALSGATSYVGSKVIPPVLSLVGKAVKTPLAWVTNKLFVPKDFYDDTTTIPARNLYNVLKQLGSSPTPGQVLESDVIQFTEGMARGGLFGKGNVTKLDKENMQLITNDVLDYINTHAKLGWQSNPFDSNGLLTEMSKARFGQLAEGVLTGKLNMASIINGKNFQAFRDSLTGKGIKVDVSPLEDILQSNPANKYIKEMYDIISPYVTPQQGTTTVSAESAYEAYRTLNSYLGSGVSKGEKWAASQFKKALEDPFKSSLPSDSLQLLETANEVFGKFATNLDNKLINNLRNKFDEFPSTAVQTIEGAERKFDTLLAIKKAYQTTSTGEATGSLMAYNRNIIEPLRYNVLQKSFVRDANIAKNIPGTGQIDGKLLEKNLDNLGEAGAEIFGGEEGLKGMYNLASAAKRIAESQASNQRSLYIKLMQGSILAGAGLGTYHVTEGDTGATLKTLGVFITPMVMAKYIVGNPNATRALIDAMTAPINTKPHNLAIAQLMAFAAKENSTELSDGLKDIYYGNALSKIAPEDDGIVQQSLQFIPQDIVEKNLLRPVGF